MKYAYEEKNFKPETLSLIYTMETIINEYTRQGFVLTVRQLYYQLVARGVIPNTLNDYKRVASVINDAKLGGYLDWDALEDRTREFIERTRWSSGQEILLSASRTFHMDMWDNQDHRVFVIVEKEALVGVLEGVCHEFDIPLLAARGYPSGSVLHEFANEMLIPVLTRGQHVTILHLGDHDPSGIDMTRDLRARLTMFAEESVEVTRIALNMDQIEQQKPPENPAKTTDSRFNDYRRRFGASSWELDALSPRYLDDLIRANVEPLIDPDAWKHREDEIEDISVRIESAATHF